MIKIANYTAELDDSRERDEFDRISRDLFGFTLDDLSRADQDPTTRTSQSSSPRAKSDGMMPATAEDRHREMVEAAEREEQQEALAFELKLRTDTERFLSDRPVDRRGGRR